MEHGVVFQVGRSPAAETPLTETVPKIYRFKSVDQNTDVALAMDFLALSTTAYAGWEKFEEDFLLIQNAFSHEFQPVTVTRLGLRFINRFTLKNTGCGSFNELIGLFRDELTCLIRGEPWSEPVESLSQIVLSDGKAKLGFRSGSVGEFFEENATTSQIFDVTLLNVEYAAKTHNTQQFMDGVKQMNWEIRPVEQFIRVIQLALSLGCHATAQRLARQGIQRYPQHEGMIKMEKILAPAKLIRKDLPPYPPAELNMQWLKQNRMQYAGQWVAIKEGQLIAAAPTFKELAAQFEYTKHSRIMVTRV